MLYETLELQYAGLGFNQLGDDHFRQLCIARIVEPTSKLDSLRVLVDLGVGELNKDQLYRCLKQVVAKDYRSTIAKLVLPELRLMALAWSCMTLRLCISKCRKKMTTANLV